VSQLNRSHIINVQLAMNSLKVDNDQIFFLMELVGGSQFGVMNLNGLHNTQRLNIMHTIAAVIIPGRFSLWPFSVGVITLHSRMIFCCFAPLEGLCKIV